MTRLDVIEQAFRRLGIKAEDEALSADQLAYAGNTLDALYAEIRRHAPMNWWPDDIPSESFIPLANLLASEIGPAYEVPTEPRSRAYMRLMAVMRPNDVQEVDGVSNAAADYF